MFEGENYTSNVTLKSTYVYYETHNTLPYNPKSKFNCKKCGKKFKSVRYLVIHEKKCDDKSKYFPVSRIISMEDLEPGSNEALR